MLDTILAVSFPPPPDWWPSVAAHSELVTSTIFPYFGGKSKIADLVWERFGNVVNYVEPYFGSGIIMRSRPHAPTIETVNDYSSHVSNVWRAIKWRPEETAEWADWPVNETDLHARHAYLVKHEAALREKLLADPDFCDPKLAGWWIWGICAWIGSGWCTNYAATRDGRKQQKPFLSGYPGSPLQGQGIHSKRMRQRLPMLAGSGGEDDHACAHHGRGVHGKTLSQRLPALSEKAATGVHSGSNRSRLYDVMAAISHRFRHTRITCGDAKRVLSDAVTWRHGLTGVFLDPPYPGDAGSTSGIYTNAKAERATFNDAFRYCVENGGNKSLRIALCYYEGTKAPLEDGTSVDVSDHLRSLGWEIVAWKAGGGYGGQSGTNKNASRERVAFSPHCLRAAQGSLFT
jgi:DNA adenine methylase